MSLDAVLLSFGVIFIAELGDKSQLMALAFAARFPALPVLIAIALATGLVHAGSVLLGATVAVALPTTLVQLVAGLAFIGFGLWTLRGDVLGGADEERVNRASSGSVILTVGTAFFLAELGVKTMLATVSLATHEDAIGTWLGSTAGMVAADAIAIGIGKLLGRNLPERAIRIGAAIAFFAFGALLVAEALATR